MAGYAGFGGGRVASHLKYSSSTAAQSSVPITTCQRDEKTGREIRVIYSGQFDDTSESEFIECRPKDLDQWDPSPEKVACWHCCHPFDGNRIGIPQKYDADRGAWHVKGSFCSFSCARAHLVYGGSVSSEESQRQSSLLNNMAQNLYGINPQEIVEAPSRFALSLFQGGTGMTIDEFRASSNTCTIIAHEGVVLPHRMVFEKRPHRRKKQQKNTPRAGEEGKEESCPKESKEAEDENAWRRASDTRHHERVRNLRRPSQPVRLTRQAVDDAGGGKGGPGVFAEFLSSATKSSSSTSASASSSSAPKAVGGRGGSRHKRAKRAAAGLDKFMKE